jgi:hypothetical protein
MMQDAIALLSPAYSTHRMVADYVRQAYDAVGRDRQPVA